MFGTVGKGGENRRARGSWLSVLLSASLSPGPVPFRARFPVAHIPARSTEGGY